MEPQLSATEVAMLFGMMCNGLVAMGRATSETIEICLSELNVHAPQILAAIRAFVPVVKSEN